MGDERVVRFGERLVGRGYPCLVAGEIGQNHQGSVDVALDLVGVIARAGGESAKLQKRTPSLHARTAPDGSPLMRESPAFPEGEMVTDLAHREATELSVDDVGRVFAECHRRGMVGFLSPWDLPSVAAIAPLRPRAWKVASASLTDLELLAAIRDAARSSDAAVVCSTGMSTEEQVERAVSVLGRDRLILLHCVSTYPSRFHELNLRYMETLRSRFQVPVGFSGHELGYAPSLAAATLGACMVERHVTLDRTMRGSDHAASLEPDGFRRMVRDIRAVESAMGSAGPRVVGAAEQLQARRLRRV